MPKGKGILDYMERLNLTPVQLYCPNCGHKLYGLTDDSGGTRIHCERCNVTVFSKRHNNKVNIQVINNN